MAIITATAIALIVKQFAKKGIEKAFDTTVEKVSEDSLNWIKKLFTRNGVVREEITDLQEKPDSPARINAVNAIFERELEDNPESSKYLKEIFEKLSKSGVNIQNSKNVNTGNISSSGGNIQLGDNHGI